MKRIITLEEFEEFEKVRYYTLRFDAEDASETDKFFDKYESLDEFKEDFDIIVEWLGKIGERGAQKNWFRPEGGSLKAVPTDPCKLRLYCFRVSDCIVLLGNGGQKKTNTYQEDPEMNGYVCALREVGRFLMTRIREGRMANEYQCKLFGNLQFTIELQ